MAIDHRLVAIFPGSFDPVTNGHLDLIERGARLMDRLIVGVLNNTSKQALFSVEERKAMLREATQELSNVEVDSFDGVLVDYLRQRGSSTILRGIRSISDCESEMQMSLLNKRLRPGTETIFMAASEQHSFISSRMIKELILLGGDVSQFVPPAVMRRVKNK